MTKETLLEICDPRPFKLALIDGILEKERRAAVKGQLLAATVYTNDINYYFSKEGGIDMLRQALDEKDLEGEVLFPIFLQETNETNELVLQAQIKYGKYLRKKLQETL